MSHFGRWVIVLAAAAGIAAGCSGSAATCGDNVCGAGETVQSCPADCIRAGCGDSQCAADETAALCPVDCFCGNGSCDVGESMQSCAADCSVASCGNLTCEPGETMLSCPSDCTTPECGNGDCEPGETMLSCPADCPTPECGNGDCEPGETMLSCPTDCTTPECGNGDCEPGETMLSCPADCTTPECGNGDCEPTEDTYSCPTDCVAVCGNGIVENGEACEGVIPAGVSCQSETGKPDGVLSCDGQCQLDTGNCSDCGDAIRDGDEECDGSDLGAASCTGLGYLGGALSCQGSCTLDESGCHNCGDGLCDLGPENAVNCVADCGWTQVTAGHYATCGLRVDGTAWCWGYGEQCQLGDGACVDRTTPVQVSGLTNVTLISTAHGFDNGAVPNPQYLGHTCAIAGGALYCWGDNYRAQLGDGTQTDRPLPNPVTLSGVVDVAAGGYNTCAVVTNGDTYCWGAHAGLGVLTSPDYCTSDWGSDVQCALNPNLVPDVPSAVEVDASHTNGCVRTTTGQIWCWGGTFAVDPGPGYGTSFYAFQIPGSTGAVGFSRGNGHGCHRQASGALYCWGFNEYGQLGTATSDYGSRAAVLATVISGVDQIGAGSTLFDWTDYGHTCVSLLTDGSVRCWGYNDVGQLGDGTTTDSLTPQTVVGLTGVTQMDGGTWHTCAVTSGDQLYCWGSNLHGELGNGTTLSSSTPVAVP